MDKIKQRKHRIQLMIIKQCKKKNKGYKRDQKQNIGKLQKNLNIFVVNLYFKNKCNNRDNSNLMERAKWLTK